MYTMYVIFEIGIRVPVDDKTARFNGSPPCILNEPKVVRHGSIF